MAVAFTPNEALLFDQIYAGLPGHLPPGTPINAKLLQQAMLEIDSFAPGPSQRRAFRWEIHNAVFDLELDLRDASRADGRSLPALEFVGCEFQSGFCADGARIERLVFFDCSFTALEFACVEPSVAGQVSRSVASVEPSANAGSAVSLQRRSLRNRISLRNTRIATELAFNGLHPNSSNGDSGILVIDAFAAVVGTNLMMANCTLHAPQGESSATVPEARFALDISTAKIGCDVRLMPFVVLEGGLKARDARIGGSFWASGLRTTDGESESSRSIILAQHHSPREAFRLETSHIEGNLVLGIDSNEFDRAVAILRDNPAAGLRMSLDEIKAGQNIPMRDTVLASSNLYCGGTLSLLNSRIGGDLLFSPGVIGADLSLVNTIVGGRSSVDEPALTGIISPSLRVVLIAGPLVVLGHCMLDNAKLNSACELRLESASISADGATFGDRCTISGTVNFLTAKGVTVAGDLTLRLTGLLTCDLTGAKINGTLNLDEIALISHQPSLLGVVQSPNLSFYPGCRVTEFLLPGGPERNPRIGVVAFLTCSAEPPVSGCWEPVPLFGDADAIHKFNAGSRWIIRPSGRRRSYHTAKPLVLETQDQARSYLRFFCSFLWGDHDTGSFSLITEARDLPDALVPDPTLLGVPCERIADSQKGLWDARAYTRYGDDLYLATYRIPANGVVTMLNDKQLARYEWSDADKLSTFSGRFRYPPAPALAERSNLKEFRSDFLGWTTLDTDSHHIAEMSRSVAGWKDFFTVGPSVVLRNVSSGVLSDNTATVWDVPSARIDIDGFDYQSVDVTPKDFYRRLAWVRNTNPSPENPRTSFGYFLLTMAALAIIFIESFRFAIHGRDLGYLHLFADQYFLRFTTAFAALCTAGLLYPFAIYRRRFRGRRSTGFTAQPYAHLAAVLRTRGEDDLAKRVEAEKMWQEAEQRKSASFWGVLSMIFWWRPYGVMFGYGLSPLRAAATLFLLWILGWNAVSLLSSNQMLRANVTRLGPAALMQTGTPLLIVPAGTNGVPPVSIPCGDAIEPGLYSFELLTPVLNLHQESRCEIEPKPNGGSMSFLGRSWQVSVVFLHAPLWEYGKALYMLVGSIVSSLALLTFSGIARRWEN